MTQFQYFLVSLIPDPIRNEQVNVGVIGFYKDDMEIRFLENPQKIKAISPNYDDRSSLGEGIKKLLNPMTTNQRFNFLSEWTDDFFTIWPPAKGKVENYEKFKVMITQIYDRLVKPVSKQPTRTSSTCLKSDIRKKFKKINILGDKIGQHEIVPDYVISRSENLRVDFAYQNGKFNVVETLD